MAGILAGVIHAPLTAIFLIAEITGGYALFIPLMVVVSLSYFISIYFEPNSAYTKGIADKGEFLLNDHDRFTLYNISLKNILETDFLSLNISGTLGNLVNAIERSNRNIFPVVDEEKKLMGIVRLDDVREIIFDTSLFNLILIRDIMIAPQAIVDVKDNIYDIVKKMDELAVWNLPVTKDGFYIGFISKSKILNHYRRSLLKQMHK